MKYRIKQHMNSYGDTRYTSQYKRWFCWWSLSFHDYSARSYALEEIELHKKRQIAGVKYEEIA